MNLSGGIGYRNRGLFLDLTYGTWIRTAMLIFLTGSQTRQITYAELKNRNSNVLAL